MNKSCPVLMRIHWLLICVVYILHTHTHRQNPTLDNIYNFIETLITGKRLQCCELEGQKTRPKLCNSKIWRQIKCFPSLLLLTLFPLMYTSSVGLYQLVIAASSIIWTPLFPVSSTTHTPLPFFVFHLMLLILQYSDILAIAVKLKDYSLS